MTWQRMLYSCKLTHTATVGVKELINQSAKKSHTDRQQTRYWCHGWWLSSVRRSHRSMKSRCLRYALTVAVPQIVSSKCE